MSPRASNNCGRIVRPVPASCGATFLEVWNTDERGELAGGDPVVSCYVEENETPAQAIAALLAEFLHPFGAAWESPEQYGRELDAVKWLADFYDVRAEDLSK